MANGPGCLDKQTRFAEEHCDGEIFRKISKNIGLVFNGSGFYLTDYANKKGSSATNNKEKKNGDAKPKNGDSKPAKTKTTETAKA